MKRSKDIKLSEEERAEYEATRQRWHDDHARSCGVEDAQTLEAPVANRFSGKFARLQIAYEAGFADYKANPERYRFKRAVITSQTKQ
jgi:hypothetical protein